TDGVLASIPESLPPTVEDVGPPEPIRAVPTRGTVHMPAIARQLASILAVGAIAVKHDPVPGFDQSERIAGLGAGNHIAPHGVEHIRSAPPRPGAGPNHSPACALLNAPY